MYPLILASLGFIPWSIYIILTYYSKNFSQIDHIESASWYGWYLFSIAVIYALYKGYSIITQEKNVKFNFWHIAGFSILQILVVAVAYSSWQNVATSPFFTNTTASGINLFIHIITLLLYPLFLSFLWRATGFSILKYIPNWNHIDLRIRIGAELSIGITIFIALLLLVGGTTWYTLMSLVGIIVSMSLVSYYGWIETYHDIRNRSIELEQHEKGWDNLFKIINPKLISIEFAFIFLTFLIAVSLINAIRPMPIGWDDLWVYMNFPRIMALTGEILHGAGMYSWQLITGTWFLINQIAANAFYINQLWWILSIIVLTSVLSYILERKDKIAILSLPLLLAGIYYFMPMTVFQQAKDMKLDPALMMVSVSSFWLLWYAIKHNTINKYLLILVVGIIVGLAFSIKFTTLILIVSILALIAYAELGIIWFLGFFSLFIGIFTGWNLWSKMNVWMPVENTWLIHTIAWVAIIIGCICITISYWKNGFESVKKWIYISAVFIGGLIIGLSPWLIKNGIEAQTFTTSQKGSLVDSMLWGFSDYRYLDYKWLYTKDEYDQKRKEQQSNTITNDGKSQNEDFSRYFGQESWLNNYLKLPANLTFQKNQSGEFTDITYIFLAFLPSILLFVRWRKFKNKEWTTFIFPISVILGMVLMVIYYFITSSWDFISNLIGNVTLPLGYLFLIGWILTIVTWSHFTISDENNGKEIKYIILMLMIYGFLFLISAFGIVWYGVFVYFLCLVLIALAALSFTHYNIEEKDTDLIGVKVTLSFLFFLFIFIYIIRSAFPHGWNNLMSAGMNEYKYNKLEQNESIFTYRNDYITPIATMNVVDTSTVVKRAGNLAKSVALRKILTPERLNQISAEELHQILIYFKIQLQAGKIIQDKQAIQNDVENIGKELYGSILSPKWADVNEKGIYRIGTFMTYLINKNRQRYLEDNLIFEFDTFFYNPSPEKTIENMKKLWIGYLLTDLNAATIDRDPRRALTTRFEHLLLSMRANNLKLIDTDNLCLKVALGEYKLGKLKNENDFIDIAGTNYESYRNGKTMYRTEKQNKCANYTINLINESSKNGTPLPSYLIELKEGLVKANWKQTEQQRIITQSFGQSYFALFEIQDK